MRMLTLDADDDDDDDDDDVVVVVVVVDDVDDEKQSKSGGEFLLRLGTLVLERPVGYLLLIDAGAPGNFSVRGTSSRHRANHVGA
jgi:hypothetical protein